MAAGDGARIALLNRHKRLEAQEIARTIRRVELPVDPEGAFYCFPSYHFDIGSVELSTRLLEEYHVATVPGLAFGDCGEGYLRLSYATSAKEIEDAMSRMETFFQNLDKNGA